VSLNYDKMQKKAGQGDDFWSSYADLATVLSTLFLMMYVMATMRQTTTSLTERVQLAKANQKIDELEQQIQAYEVLKEKYLQEGASSAEKKMYKDLMAQMKLLEQQAAAEKERLQKEAAETAKKADGLNHYQSMIKNIITANMIAQSEMKSRDQIIAKKSENITELRKEIKTKESEIEKNNREIAKIESKLNESIKQVQYAYRSKARSKQKLSREIEKLKEESQKKVAALRQQNQKVTVALLNTREDLDKTSQELEQKQNILQERQSQLAQMELEKKRIAEQMKQEQKAYQNTVEEIKKQHEQKLAAERTALKESLDKANLSAQARMEKERQYRERVESQIKDYNAQMSQLSEKLEDTREEILKKQREVEGTKAMVAQKQEELEGTRAVNAAMEAEIKARQEKFEKSMEELKQAHQTRLMQEQQRMQANLEKQKLTAAQKVAEEKAYAARVEAEKQAYAAQMDKLNSELAGSRAEIESKDKEIAGAKAAIAQREAQMKEAEASFQQKLEEERDQFEANLAKQQLTAAQRAKKEADYRQKLESDRKDHQSKMAALAGQLEGTRAALEGTKAVVASKSRELASAKQALAQGEAEMKAREEGYQKKLAQERSQFEASLTKEKLTGAQRAQREAAYRRKLEGDKKAHEAEMKALEGQLAGTKAVVVQTAAQNQGLSRQLAAIQARDQHRRRIISKLSDGFKRAGIDARIDPKTGEVTINFGEEYFDYGSAQIKNGMKSVLEKAVPVYAKSILDDKEIADKISSVEIIGFASPTYKGKYINPKELTTEARRAVNYNMDLSYKRAKSIFEYAFDPKQMKYDHQNSLLSLTKVTGIGYLRAQGAEGAANDTKLTDDQYCEKYDCAKSQKVLIKFNFKELTGE
jgi:chromosome segregation ATPase